MSIKGDQAILVGTKQEISVKQPYQRAVLVFAGVAAVLAAVAGCSGLFVPDFYQEYKLFIPLLRGQDLVTLLTLPLLAAALLGLRRNAAWAALVLFGLCAYLIYAYTVVVVAYGITRLYRLHLILSAFSALALAALLAGIQAPSIRQRFVDAAPRIPATGMLLLMAAAICFSESGELLAWLGDSTTPLMKETEGRNLLLLLTDLGLLIPLCLVTAGLLWRRRAWGYVLAGALLVLGAAIGLALLGMEWFAVRAGFPPDGLQLLWVAMAAGCAGTAYWFLAPCRTLTPFSARR
jgi:hypothetical protein